MKKRCDKLIAKLREKNIDAAIITSPVNRRYFSGFTGSNGVVIVTENGRVLLTDFRYTIQANQQCAGVCEVRQVNRGIGSGDVEEVLKEFDAKRVAYEDAALTVAEFNMFKSMPFELLPESKLISDCRIVKDAAEIAELQKAQNVADAAFAEVLKHVKVGMTEIELRNEFDYLIRKFGGDDNSFDTIVGSGPNGALCHAYPGPRKIQNGDFVVMDFGARVNGYCSDMTRTVFVGQPDARMRAAYETLREANERVEAAIKPGVTGAQMHQMAEDALAAGGFAGKMGHGLGHGVGIDIHEEPVLSPRNKEPLVPGNVVTVEPGIYLEGDFGMRLEDFGVVTETGFQVFTQSTHDMVII